MATSTITPPAGFQLDQPQQLNTPVAPTLPPRLSLHPPPAPPAGGASGSWEPDAAHNASAGTSAYSMVGVGSTLAREAIATGKTAAGLLDPRTYYHMTADKATDEEEAYFGKGQLAKVGPTGRLLARTGRAIVQPVS